MSINHDEFEITGLIERAAVVNLNPIINLASAGIKFSGMFSMSLNIRKKLKTPDRRY